MTTDGTIGNWNAGSMKSRKKRPFGNYRLSGKPFCGIGKFEETLWRKEAKRISNEIEEKAQCESYAG